MMMLISGNWYFAQHAWGTGFVSHLWSISVEEQFYLVWPIFLKLGGRQTLWAGSIGLSLLSLFSLLFLGLRNNSANPTAAAGPMTPLCR
jgi:peptidoglycan/LPS O-acetylase OafA/YrhL